MQLTLLSLTTFAVLSIVAAHDVSVKLVEGSLQRKLDSDKKVIVAAELWDEGVDFWERELKHSSDDQKKHSKKAKKSKKSKKGKHHRSKNNRSHKHSRRDLGEEADGDVLEFWDRELKHSSHGNKKKKNKSHKVSKSKKGKHHKKKGKSNKYSRRELVKKDKDGVVDYWDREFGDSEEYEVSSDVATSNSIDEINNVAEFWERELKHSSKGKHNKSKGKKSKKGGKHHKNKGKSNKHSRRALFDEREASEFWERELKKSSHGKKMKHSKKSKKSKRGKHHKTQNNRSHKHSRRVLNLDELEPTDGFYGEFAAPLTIIDEQQNTQIGHVRRR